MIRCPFCNESYYMENYSTSTLLYSPIIYKDGEIVSHNPNIITHYCTCCVCGKEFDYKEDENGFYQ